MLSNILSYLYILSIFCLILIPLITDFDGLSRICIYFYICVSSFYLNKAMYIYSVFFFAFIAIGNSKIVDLGGQWVLVGVEFGFNFFLFFIKYLIFFYRTHVYKCDSTRWRLFGFNGTKLYRRYFL